MAPALAQAGGIAPLHTGGAYQLSQAVFGGLPLQQGAGLIPEAHAAPGCSKPFVELKLLLFSLKRQRNGWISLRWLAPHGDHRSAAAAHRQKQGTMHGLGEGALAAFIGTLQHVQSSSKAQLQLLMHAVVLKIQAQQPHGQGSWLQSALSSCSASCASSAVAASA